MTPLQSIIQDLETKIAEQKQREVAAEFNHVARLGKIVAYEQAIQLIQSYLPKERDEIVAAYNQGSIDTYRREPVNGGGTNYFNQKYNQ